MKRRAVVTSNPNLSAKELCEMFDNVRIPVSQVGAHIAFRLMKNWSILSCSLAIPLR